MGDILVATKPVKVLEIAYEEGVEKFQLELFAENAVMSKKKRLFDIVFSALILLLVFSWLYPLLAIIIKATSKGSILFIQKRIGYNGKVFDCYKFRTMHNVSQKLKYTPTSYEDPRITKVGKFLRKTNLDELPQFINVLLGDMSVVGPRPHAIAFHNTYSTFVGHIDKRHMVKPGITGWAQVNGLRGDVDDMEENKMRTVRRIDFDIQYIKSWSFKTDLKIVNKTCLQMISNKTNGH